MAKKDTAPEQIVLEYLRANGEVISKIDLGAKYLSDNNIEMARSGEPFRIGISKQMSKAGNAFYDYSQNAIPLPDGLSTFIRIEGVIILWKNTAFWEGLSDSGRTRAGRNQ